MNDRVRPMTRHHAPAVAQLHRIGIRSGFLSSLGRAFLRQLYAAIPSCASGFAFVWHSGEGEVLGFIACAVDIGRLYKEALRRRGVRMALTLMRFAFRASVIRRIVETLRYPCQAGEDLPAAEVLSIAVSEKARGSGIGKALMQAAFKEFQRRGVGKVKVAVGGNIVAGNNFYRRCGFTLAATREHHGLPMNVYVATIGAASANNAASGQTGIEVPDAVA